MACHAYPCVPEDLRSIVPVVDWFDQLSGMGLIWPLSLRSGITTSRGPLQVPQCPIAIAVRTSFKKLDGDVAIGENDSYVFKRGGLRARRLRRSLFKLTIRRASEAGTTAKTRRGLDRGRTCSIRKLIRRWTNKTRMRLEEDKDSLRGSGILYTWA